MKTNPPPNRIVLQNLPPSVLLNEGVPPRQNTALDPEIGGLVRECLPATVDREGVLLLDAHRPAARRHAAHRPAGNPHVTGGTETETVSRDVPQTEDYVTGHVTTEEIDTGVRVVRQHPRVVRQHPRDVLGVVLPLDLRKCRKSKEVRSHQSEINSPRPVAVLQTAVVLHQTVINI